MSNAADTDRVADLAQKVVADHDPKSVPISEFLGAAYDAGLSWVHFPEGLGGLGVSRGNQAVADRILQGAGSPVPLGLNPMGYGMAAPTIREHAQSEDVKRSWLRPLATTEDIWCQLFSEPGAGSDLAGLATSAVRDGEDWVINGQKVWTSLAHRARWGLLLARTNPDVPKHKGLTYFVIDMHSPGVETRPLRQLTGQAEFNEVYFTDARIPDAHRLGEIGNGWAVAMTTLMNERSALGGSGSRRGAGTIAEATSLWASRPHRQTPVLRDRLTQLWLRSEAQRLTSERSRASAGVGGPGPEGSIGKLVGAELNQHIYQFCMDFLGPEGILYQSYALPEDDREDSDWRGPIQQRFLRSRANTIEGGTSDVMRNILGERVLGLPGDLRADAGMPWKEIPVAKELADQPDKVANDTSAFTFTDEQDQLRRAVRKFSAENFDEPTVRRLMESDPPFDLKSWTRLGTELGVLGLSVSEADGGVGGTLVDQAVAVEELGAALACGPIFGTVFLAIPALVAAPAGKVRDELLAELVEGRRTAAFAIDDDAGAFDPAAVDVTASGSGDAWTLTGTIEQVVDAGAADEILVAATGPDGLALYAVDATGPGVERTALLVVDPTRPQASISLADAPARLLAGPEEAERVITHALQVGSALLAVEQVGAAQHILDVAVQYAKERLQFGRQIGSFQAVKHRLADMLVDLEHARSTAYHAVWALTDGSDDPALAASIAQAICSAAFSRIATDAIQTLGGIGFTWEHQAHLYFKRATTDAALLGSAEQHRARVADLVLDTASADKAPRVADGT